jgi:DNA polymerase V
MAKQKPHGGRRPRAGRPAKYGEPTQVIRVPKSRVPQVEALLKTGRDQIRLDTETLAALYRPQEPPTRQSLPLFATRIEAGFPSPADDSVEGQLDLNDHLIKHPAATFYVRGAGDSMTGAGIHPGDILVVDRALEPTSGKIVIAVVNGELTVKRLVIQNDQVILQPENGHYRPIPISEPMDFVIWGVVTGVVRQL